MTLGLNAGLDFNMPLIELGVDTVGGHLQCLSVNMLRISFFIDVLLIGWKLW